jgi:hypothetical protein
MGIMKMIKLDCVQLVILPVKLVLEQDKMNVQHVPHLSSSKVAFVHLLVQMELLKMKLLIVVKIAQILVLHVLVILNVKAVNSLIGDGLEIV